MTENRVRYTLGKEERLYSLKRIETLFQNGDSFISYPLRIVYTIRERSEGDVPVSILVSVSKRRFKRAVKRNRVKRLIKEAYRLNKQDFIKLDFFNGKSIDIAFIYLKEVLPDYAEIEKSIIKTWSILTEKIDKKDETKENLS